MCTADDSDLAFARHHEFTELLQESRSRLYGYLFALVHDASDADDLFQAVAAILWEKFDSFEDGTNFTAWALKVGSLVYRNFARSQRRSRVSLSDDAIDNLAVAANKNSDCGSTMRMDALQSCLAKLPKSDRNLIQLCYTDSRRIKDIATQVGRTDHSVYSAIARIRRSLVSCVERKLAIEFR